jgi:hypothetical protein
MGRGGAVAQVRQADDADWRNILLDDRRLRRQHPRRAERSNAAFFMPFENRDAPARGEMFWTQKEIEQLLLALGLPVDAPLSVLCVEMMPTLDALLTRQSQLRETASDQATFAEAAIAQRSGGVAAMASSDYVESRPLSDDLGHHRILRTSPLVAAPAVC